ncbi:formate transporter FocA [Vibrio cholerae]
MTQTHNEKVSFSPAEMMAQAEKFAFSKANKTSMMTLSLAIMAGAFIGLAFVFYITVTTDNAGAGWGLSRLVGGLAFSMGLILIVICGGELFTSSVLSSISWANRQISATKMLSIWGKVYLGNFIGASLLLIIVFFAGLYGLDHGQWGLNALNIAQHKLHHTPVQAFALGVLCNLLVCLAIWLTFSSANTMTKAAMTVMPVAMFVSSGFEHCVANMFMVPLGIAIHSFAPEPFWTKIGVPASQFNDLTVGHFITANLIPVTLGNIVGGAVLVGLANWSIYRRPQLKAADSQAITQPAKISAHTLYRGEDTVTIGTIMDTQPVQFVANTPVGKAIDTLLEQHIDGAPVVNTQNELIGFFSIHDAMIEMWSHPHHTHMAQSVVTVMNDEISAVSASDTLLDVLEYFCLDKAALFPTSSMGYATQLNAESLTARAKHSPPNRPSVLPVLADGRLVGVVTRAQVLRALQQTTKIESKSPYGADTQDEKRLA